MLWARLRLPFGLFVVPMFVWACGSSGPSSPAGRSPAAWFRVVNMTPEPLTAREGKNVLVAGLPPMEGKPFAPMRARAADVDLTVSGRTSKVHVSPKSGETLTVFALPGKSGFAFVTLVGEPRESPKPESSVLQIVRVSERGASPVDASEVASPAGLSGSHLVLPASTAQIRLRDGSTLPLQMEPGYTYTAVFPTGAGQSPFLLVNSISKKPLSSKASVSG